jgi:ABC-2 type transport system permease protein
MSDPQRPAPPGSARVALIVARIAVRRFANCLAGHFSAAFGSKRKADETRRTGTARKGGVGVVMLLFFGALFLFNGINLSTQFVRKLTVSLEKSPDNDSRTPVDESVYRAVLTAQEWRPVAEQFEAQPERPRRRFRAAQRESQKNLREWFIHDFHLREKKIVSDKDERAQRHADALMKVFEERGAEGFKIGPPHRPTSPIPSEALWPLPSQQPDFIKASGLIMIMIALSLFLMSLGSANQDLGKMDWSMEWLFTFPVDVRGLLIAQWVEFSIVNALNWFIVFPFLFVVLWCAGKGWYAVPLGILGAAYFGLLLGALRLLAETWLRKHIAPAGLKNLQALITLLGTLSFFALLGTIAMETVPQVLLNAAENVPDRALLNPISLPVLLLNEEIPRVLAMMLLFVCGIGIIAVNGAAWMVRDGLLSSAGAYRGARGPALSAEGEGWFSGIIAKELRLLSRDRNFMVQTLLVPLLIMGFNIILHPDLWKATLGNFTHASTLAFGLGAYVLMFSACQVLAAEGNALWMLYTFPRDLHGIFVRKTFLWCAFAALYTIVTLIVAVVYNPALSISAVSDASIACIGVVIYSFIAAGIGVLATDPLEQEVRRKLRPEMMYLYLMLTAFYAYAIYADSAWTKIAQIVLSTLLAFSLWQKVRDRMPYMLDPTQEPPPSIALSDGLIAVLAFFVLQGLAGLAMINLHLPQGMAILVAFVVAGLLVTLLSLYIFWRTKVPRLLSAVGILAQGDGQASWLKSIFVGALGGTLGVGVALGYLFILERVEPLRELKNETLKTTMKMDAGMLSWIAVLAVVAAPLFEEYIFRGLVYRGLRRSTGPLLATLASAAIFAVVHPPLAVVPVFVMGVIAALCFEHCRLLIAPIIVHMVYNGVMVGVQLLALEQGN